MQKSYPYPTAEDIKLAAQQLQAGKLVAFPTETVYGLGGDARNGQAIASLYEAKGRPAFNPLIVHISSLEKAKKLGVFNDTANHLATRFWPGALTLVVPRQTDCPISELASAGLPTIALRVPNHPLAQQLLTTSDCPLAAPSANRSGHLSPTSAQHVRSSLPDVTVLDGGQTSIGLESTIIGCLEARPVMLRKGGIARHDIELATGLPLEYLPDEEATNARLAPGRLARHYAPKAQLRLNAINTEHDEALLAFGADIPVHHEKMLNLSPTGDVMEAAANLFAYLHQLDTDATNIAVMPIPNTGVGEAINDRLNRAARGRS